MLLAALSISLGAARALAQGIARAEPADVPRHLDRPAPDHVATRIVRLESGADAVTAGVHIAALGRAGARVLVARNYYHGPVQIAVYRSAAEYDAGRLPLHGLPVLPPRSETELWPMPFAAATAGSDYYLLHIPGDPLSRHAPDRPYRLPYAVESRHAVSQAYPERITHTDPSSWHAVDFAMPLGTGVYAARAGVVMQVAADYYRSETDSAGGPAPANLIRILHTDGTMGVYAHLSGHSIAVVPGEHVARGQHIADSGNTGFSTGPHLHFVVQRNRGGAIASVPVHFAGLGGRPLGLRSGDMPVAY